jgi:glycosyltransferase involved in cell wall biosynthesis
VRRFPVRRPRRLKRFAEISDEVFDGRTTAGQQEEWFRENGPDCPALLDFLRVEGDRFDLVLFWTFRYAPSFFGVPLVRDRAVLLPTAEEDRAVDLSILEEFFQLPAAYLFLTPEEQTLVSTRAGRTLEPAAVIGMGLEPAPAQATTPRPAGVATPYLLYLGRVDRNKGCDALLEYFLEYAAAHEGLSLVLAGPAKMTIPVHPRIRGLGRVSDADRDALLQGALALVVPSPFESLSIVLLEAWNRGVPAIVNGHCAVLKGQVRRANGGLYYRSSAEFGETVETLRDADGERQRWVREAGLRGTRYRWATVMARVDALNKRGRTPLAAKRRQAWRAPRASAARSSERGLSRRRHRSRSSTRHARSAGRPQSRSTPRGWSRTGRTLRAGEHRHRRHRGKADHQIHEERVRLFHGGAAHARADARGHCREPRRAGQPRGCDEERHRSDERDADDRHGERRNEQQHGRDERHLTEEANGGRRRQPL